MAKTSTLFKVFDKGKWESASKPISLYERGDILLYGKGSYAYAEEEFKHSR
jgi:hypothetical protein